MIRTIERPPNHPIKTPRVLRHYVLVFTLLGSVGCSSPTPTTRGQATVPAPTSSASASLSHRSPSGLPTPSVGTSSKTSNQSKTTLRVEGVPSCIERTGTYEVRYFTEPGAVVAGAATYSDGSQYGSSFAAQADSTGTHTYEWIPPPIAPLGRGNFKAGAEDPPKAANNITFPFEMRPAGGCRS